MNGTDNTTSIQAQDSQTQPQLTSAEPGCDGSTGDPLIDSMVGFGDSAKQANLNDEIESLSEEGGDSDGLREKENGEEAGEEVKEEEAQEESAEGDTEAEKKEVTTKQNQGSTKVLVGKQGEKEVEVSDDTTFTFNVDGKQVSPPLSELIQNYKGKIPWDRHYRQLKEDRAKFDSDVKAAETKVREVVELSHTDPFKALERLVVMAGKNPADFLQTYLAQAQKTAEEIAAKSDAELKQFIDSKRIEYEKERVQREKMAVRAEKGQMEAETYIVAAQTEHGISDDELESAWALAKAPENIQLLAGKTPKQTAETIIRYILEVDRPYTLIENTVEEISPELRKNGAFLNELKGHFNGFPNLTKEDIRIVVEGYMGKAPTEGNPDKPETGNKSLAKTSKEALKERPANRGPNPLRTTPKKAAKGIAALEDFDPIGFDSLDSLSSFFKSEE